MRKSVVFLLLLLYGVKGFAQNEIISFSAKQVNDHVLVSFTLEMGITCSGLIIERSADGVTFTGAGSMPGICGSASSAESYTFSDFSPVLNQESYYRLNMGNAGYSNTIQVTFYDYDESGVIVFPNPITTKGTIYFLNPKGEPFSFYVYNQEGKMVLVEDTSFDRIILNRSQLNSGVYFYLIRHAKDHQIKGSGKLLIL